MVRVAFPVVLGVGVGLAGFLAVSGARAAEDKAPGKLEVKAAKGKAVEFTLKQSSENASNSSRGEFKSSDQTETTYRIEVADRKDNGDLSLKVTYVGLKAKLSGRDGNAWEFDSTKTGSDDDAASQVRKAMESSITVDVKGGRVSEISGLPEVQRPEGGQGGDFRGFRARSLVSRRSLRNDLELILASAVQGQSLEKGKEYRAAEAQDGDRGGDGGGRGGRGFRGGFTPRVANKFEGEEKAAAKFSLTTFRPERQGGDGNRGGNFTSKGEGTALVSLEDGLLLSMTLTSESKGEFERDGQSSSFERKSRTEITRGAGAAKKDSPLKL
jgi:hypothetical protein